jgi:hypothetical protein
MHFWWMKKVLSVCLCLEGYCHLIKMIQCFVRMQVLLFFGIIFFKRRDNKCRQGVSVAIGSIVFPSNKALFNTAATTTKTSPFTQKTPFLKKFP